MEPTSPTAGILDVQLGDVHVGTLTLLSDERIEFVTSEEYRQRSPRLVLGQVFEDDLTRRHVSATLSPAYDLVSTLQYMANDTLALNLAKSKRFEDVSLASFERLARKLSLTTDDVLPVVRSTVSATLDTWSSLRPTLPLPDTFKQRIEAHWQRVPLLQGRQ